ncbi:hypothetical protein [Sphingomonas sp. HMP6]|uniref:hypothetical protein n=1 Tax=Sphingomonas sp. HMP6 TaxID=1517551 RepID=UPI001596E164|nr:hypothetical protein [Sphingomonas sp. HMP6]BCA60616.1 hypothetical protein HMP06_3385 [Sphingomonas sp. HMP6]
MNSKLVLEYKFSRDGDAFGWLKAEVHTPRFSGRNGAWVQWQDVGDFAASLSKFPIETDSPALCEWGFGEKGQYAEITKVSIAPKALTGGLVADVSLANWYEPTQRCSTRFDTDYPSLARFQQEIERMMRERVGSAVLHGSADFS